MPSDDSAYVKGLFRNVLIGLVLAFVGSVGLCLPATGELGEAAAIAAVPAMFAGPYIGILLTLIGAITRHQAAERAALESPATDAPSSLHGTEKPVAATAAA